MPTSSEVTVTTEGPPAPSNVTATVQSNDQIDVGWTDNGLNHGQYHVQIRRDGGSWVNPSGGLTTVSNTKTSVHYGADSDKPYNTQVGIDSSFQFRVRAEADGTNSSWAYSATVYTDPVPPRILDVSRPDAKTVKIKAEPRSDIGEGIEIDFREDTGSGYGNWTNFDNISPNEADVGDPSVKGDTVVKTYSVGKSYEFSSLQSDSRYQFRIRQWSVASGSPKSEWVYHDYGNQNSVYFKDNFSSGNTSSWDNEVAGGNVASSGSHGDTGINGPATGGHYFAGYGKNGTNSTWLQKNLGDLSNESNVHVRCRFAVGSLDGGGENFGIDWYDGSSWRELTYKHLEYNSQGWFEVHEIVPDSWLSSDNRIRVGTTTGSGMYNGDHFAVDEVIVADLLDEYTKPASPNNLRIDTTTEGEITATVNGNASVTHKASFSSSKFTFKRDGSLIDKQFPSPIGDVTETFSGLLDGEQYDLSVVSQLAQPRHGSRSTYFHSPKTLTASPTTLLPAPSLSASVTTGETEVDLSGTLNDDNPDGSFTFRNTTDSRDVASRTVGSSLTVTDTNVDDGVTYKYVLERSTPHTTATSAVVSQRAPKTPTRAVSDLTPTTTNTTRSVTTARSTAHTAATAVSFTRGSVTAPRSLSAASEAATNATRAVSTARSGDDTATATTAFERAVLAPRSLSSSSDTTTAATRGGVTAAREATLASGTTGDVVVALREVFNVGLREHEIQYDPDRVLFHTEWFDEPPLRRGANTLAVRLGPQLDGPGVKCRVEIDTDGDGERDVTGNWASVTDEQIPVTLDTDLDNATQIRIAFRDVRLPDAITRVGTSYTTR